VRRLGSPGLPLATSLHREAGEKGNAIDDCERIRQQKGWHFSGCFWHVNDVLSGTFWSFLALNVLYFL
jgi:hypothetical protein